MSKSRIFLMFALLTAFLTILKTEATALTNNHISFINVGQGDSSLLQDTNGFDILIDGGRQSAGPTVVAYLNQKGIAELDVMVVTHADADHAGGLIDVLQDAGIQVLAVYYNGYPGDTLTWYTLETAVANEGLSFQPVQRSQSYTWGNFDIQILNPPGGLTNPDQNDVSIVLLASDGNIDYLYTADIDSSIEADLVSLGTPIASEVLKVAHHGSSYSTSPLFVSAVMPSEAVISVGANSYGHPSLEVIDRLIASGARVWRTDVDGTIVIESDGIQYQVLNVTQDSFVVFLPVIRHNEPPPTPTPSPTSTQTAIPTTIITETPTATATTLPPTITPTIGPVITGNVQITGIFYDGSGTTEPDEYVQIRNDDSRSIQLQSWTLRDIANHVYTFPAFVISPGQSCRIYTNQVHPEWCSFSYGSGSAIWNNTGDCAYLRNSSGSEIDSFCY